MKAMILAAGRGARLHALTAHTPKPLLLVHNQPLVTHLLRALAAAGIHDIVMNVSYLADKIQDTLGDGRAYGVTLRYSVEPTALETGGGIYQALPLLGDAPFLVVSGDVYTDYPWQCLSERANTVSHAHLVFVNNPSYHAAGDFGLDEGVVSLTSTPKLTYASFGILHPRLFQQRQAGIFRLTDVLVPAISQGHVTGEHYDGQWHNVGTREELDAIKGLA